MDPNTQNPGVPMGTPTPVQTPQVPPVDQQPEQVNPEPTAPVTPQVPPAMPVEPISEPGTGTPSPAAPAV